MLHDRYLLTQVALGLRIKGLFSLKGLSFLHDTHDQMQSRLVLDIVLSQGLAVLIQFLVSVLA